MILPSEVGQMFQKLILIFYQTLPKDKRGRKTFNSFYEAKNYSENQKKITKRKNAGQYPPNICAKNSQKTWKLNSIT